MDIRPFTENDRDAVIALWQVCDLTRPWNDPNKDIDRKLQFQPELFLVGMSDSKLIASAMAGYDGHRGSVFYLGIHPDHQNQGLGQKFIQHIENILAKIGCPKINILIRSTNTNVLKFYNRIGYATDEVVSVGKRLIPDTEK